jgi:hypothetical protein
MKESVVIGFFLNSGRVPGTHFIIIEHVAGTIYMEAQNNKLFSDKASIF